MARSKAAAVAAADRARVSATKVRDEVPAANAGWEAYLDDVEIAGPLISGAVAFRMFLWLLPLTLISVVGFGLLASASHSSTQSLARTAGVRGLAAQSISQATSTSTRGRWLLIGIGVVALVSTSSSLAKALWRCSELAWHVKRTKPPGKVRSVGALVVLACTGLATSAGISRLREEAKSLVVVGILIAVVMWGLLWLAGSWLLPHGDAPWTALVPGALLVAFCAEALRVLTVYYVARKVGSSSAVYGGLGAAAALLTWFYLVARAMVGSLVLNATLWGRRQRGIPNGFRRVAPGNGQESTVETSTSDEAAARSGARPAP